MSRARDWTNTVVGDYKVLRIHSFAKNGTAKWLCECMCDCAKGSVKVVFSTTFKAGKMLCPCRRREAIADAKRTHKMTDTPEYRSWRSMKSRCNNKNNPDYHLYGGRGITFCERWNDFENFYADMGPRPDGMTLDRKNTNGNYEPGNCRWATDVDQSNNRRSSVYVTCDGECLTLAQWARKLGVGRQKLIARRLAGWSDHEIVHGKSSTVSGATHKSF